MKKSFLPLALALTLCAVDANATAVQHVILISVDALHQNDVDWFIKNHPNSTLATLANHGVQYTNARTPFPSDSFPGLIGQVTGGNPKTTGIYYDVSYNRQLLPPGTSDCAGATPGTQVAYDESLDKDPDRLDAGQGILGLYKNAPNSYQPIVKLSGNPKNLIDAGQLPVDPVSCKPVYPHQYLKVNTVFEVAHGKHLRTAWSDKHPAYEIVSGPSGQGVSEFFTPEINGLVTLNGSDAFSDDNLSTQSYDQLKVDAVINWAQGKNHAGTATPGIPAIFGMNFLSVSTAQKLNFSNYRDPSNPANVIANGLGGYVRENGELVPGPVLAGALSFVDKALGKIVAAADNNTAVIVSAKHGQAPEARASLTIVNDDDMLAALDNAWNAAHPSATGLVAHALDDDGVLIWLKDRSLAATNFAKNFLLNYSGTGIGSDRFGNTISKNFSQAGLQTVYAGVDAAKFMQVDVSDARVPDVIGIAKPGTVFAGSKLKKIAEHGGNAVNDRHVPIIVWGPGVDRGVTVTTRVATTQIAPTILSLLGLDPNQLQAVQSEKTKLLPQLYSPY